MTAKVLIIDDDEDLLRLLVTLFQSKGYEVHSFTMGKEALTYLKNETNLQGLSLIILDRILPDMDGVDILRFLKEKKGESCPVLILSLLAAEKDVLHGLEMGAVDYVAKPFSTSVLMQKAQALIGKK